MKLKATPQNLILSIFVAIEAIIYVIFNIVTATIPGDTIYLKYSGILLCLATSAALIPFYKRDAVVLTLAMIFTAISDLFILVLDSYYEVGVSTFIVTQSVYLFRLNIDDIKKIYITLSVRAVIAGIVIGIMAAFSVVNALVVLVAIYFTMLCANCAEAFAKKRFLFAVGLLLFIGCDVCVGLHNFGPVLGIALPAGVLKFAGFAIWAFYLPSQVIIVCSVDKKNEREQV